MRNRKGWEKTLRRLAIGIVVLLALLAGGLALATPWLEAEGYALPWLGPPKPPYHLALSPGCVVRGEMAGVAVWPAFRRPLLDVTGAVEGVAGVDELTFFEVKGRYVCLIGVGYSTEPGDYPMRLVITDHRRRQHEVALTISVANREFAVQHLRMSQEQTDLMTRDRLAEDRAKLAAARATPTPRQLWAGPFIQPIEGRVTTEFGQIRYVNGVYYGRHSGIDWGGNPAGTPVAAAAAGRVAFTGELWAAGNTVLLDHGLGLNTSYIHLSRISVGEGQMVEAGEIIGEVGSTGFSTGPHLHFTMSVGTVATNPWPWFEADPASLLTPPDAGGP